jgi:hypothetical protein
VDGRARLRPGDSLCGLALGGLALGAVATSCATGAPGARVLARGVLPYGVATAGEAVVTVELSERFELVVRDGGAARRLDLGPPEHDLRALAVDGASAFVGSDAGFVHEIDLRALRQVRTYAVGAPLRALAADARYLVSADASGALCLRRRHDGALLQCALTPQPVTELRLQPSGDGADARVQLTMGEAPPLVWALPTLAALPMAAPAGDAAIAFRGGAVHPVGRRVVWQRGGEEHVLAELATDVRGVAVTRSGALVIAAWPRSLDDAVLLLIPPR